MKIHYTVKFVKKYKRLPREIKLLAEKRESIFKSNWRDPRLKTHKLQGKFKDFWAFSINYSYRLIFELTDEETVWFHSVGTHDIYEE